VRATAIRSRVVVKIVWVICPDVPNQVRLYSVNFEVTKVPRAELEASDLNPRVRGEWDGLVVRSQW
jgi:hypothetical protein